jgi:formylglycine-generating enzyme required for sulfatase activity
MHQAFRLSRFLLGAATLSCLTTGCGGEPPSATSDDSFRECDDCPLMIVVPAGEFQMGAEGGEPGRYEGPVHTVTIRRPFAVGVFELTNAEYGAFVEATGHQSGENCRIWAGQMPVETPGRSWSDPGYGRPPRPDEPVACINWNDAKAYAAWLAEVTGEPYRLLSEAEWEYVARGNTPKKRYTWGDAEEPACDYANLFDQSATKAETPRPFKPVNCDDGYVQIAPVGQFRANVFGVHDILGNVWEWVEDCYVMTYLDSQTTEQAQVKHGCDRRGVRGGSWSTVVDRQRPEFRGRDPVELTTQIFGTRIARDLEPSP